MSESSPWSPAKIALWAIAAALVAYVQLPRFVESFRPKEGAFMDTSQEWLSAKNYFEGTPVYADQNAALLRHTGMVIEGNRALFPWNAHPPFSVVLTLPLGKLGYQDAHLAWNLVTLPMLLISIVLVIRELQIVVRIWSIFPAIVLLLMCTPVYVQIAHGQWNSPILFLLTLAWVADRRNYFSWAGATIGIAAAIKIFPAFLFIYFLLCRRWTAILAGGLVFVALNCLSLAILGPEEFKTYVEKVIPSLSNYQTYWNNVSLNGFWLRIFNPAPADKITPLLVNPRLATTLVLVSRVVVVALVSLWCWRARSVSGHDRAFAAALVGTLLISPITWSHYFLLLLIPVALLWMRMPSGPGRWLMWLVIVQFWTPETLYISLSLGAKQGLALAQNRHETISAATNLAVCSLYTYALVILFILVLCLPVDDDPPAEIPTPQETG